MTKDGAGTLIFSGSAGYSGLTTVNAGTLQIGNNGPSGAITGDLANYSAVVFKPGGTYGYAGAISGTGSVGKSGSGTLTLSGNLTYNGATTVNQGELDLNPSSGPLAGDLAVTGGTAVLYQGYLIPGNISVSGGVLNLNGFSQTPMSVSLNGGLITGATLSPANDYTVTAGTAAANLAGFVNLAMNGPGLAMLSGNNSYSGSTTVNGGELDLNTTGTPSVPGNLLITGGKVKLLQNDQIATGGSVGISGGTLDIGANTNTVTGVQITSGALIGSGTLTTSPAVYMQSGYLSTNLACGLTLSGNPVTLGDFTATGVLTFGSSAGANNIVAASLNGNGTVGGLAGQMYSVTASTLSIASGKTLSVNGNVHIGASQAGPGTLPQSSLAVSGGGTLAINNPGGFVFVGSSGGESGAVLNLGSLSALNANFGTQGPFLLVMTPATRAATRARTAPSRSLKAARSPPGP